MVGGSFILYGPVTVFRYLLVSGGVVWAGLLAGSIVILMGLIMWFAPHQRTLAGLLAVLFSVASFVSTNLGGFFIGMLLGIIGGAMGFAWSPLKGQAVESAASEEPTPGTG